MGVVIPIAVGVIVSGLLVFAALRARRKREREPERQPERQPEREQDIPELNKHPERLEQMLDQSDDA